MFSIQFWPTREYLEDVGVEGRKPFCTFEYEAKQAIKNRLAEYLGVTVEEIDSAGEITFHYAMDIYAPILVSWPDPKSWVAVVRRSC